MNHKLTQFVQIMASFSVYSDLLRDTKRENL